MNLLTGLSNKTPFANFAWRMFIGASEAMVACTFAMFVLRKFHCSVSSSAKIDQELMNICNGGFEWSNHFIMFGTLAYSIFIILILIKLCCISVGMIKQHATPKAKEKR